VWWGRGGSKITPPTESMSALCSRHSSMSAACHCTCRARGPFALECTSADVIMLLNPWHGSTYFNLRRTRLVSNSPPSGCELPYLLWFASKGSPNRSYCVGVDALSRELARLAERAPSLLEYSVSAPICAEYEAKSDHHTGFTQPPKTDRQPSRTSTR
jgi:hypothetical protein